MDLQTAITTSPPDGTGSLRRPALICSPPVLNDPDVGPLTPAGWLDHTHRWRKATLRAEFALPEATRRSSAVNIP